MIEKIEKKMEEYIFSILKKETIDYHELEALSIYLNKLKADEQAAKWEEEKKERSAELLKVFGTVLN